MNGIEVDPANPVYASVDGVLFNNGQTTLLQFPGGKPGNYAIPGTVTSIGAYAFYDCDNFTGVTIPNTVTNIGDDAFSECDNPVSFAVPNGVTSIGDLAFFNCLSLTSIFLGSGVTNIGETPFGGSYLTVDPLNPAFSSANGMLFDKNQTAIFQCPASLTGSLTIPDSVTNIPTTAFYGCTNLTALYFKGNAPCVESAAFYYDSGIIIYYLPGTMGWSATLGGRPTVLWNPQAQTGDGSFGVQAKGFGFNITGSSNLIIVVEANTNLADSGWVPVGTNRLNTFLGTNGTSYFSDPVWSNYPGRFYRLRSP